MDEVENRLVVSGVARSGTTLVARILNSHPSVALDSDPYLPLFKSLRNSTLREKDCQDKSVDPDSPFEDFYFSKEKVDRLDSLLNGKLDLKFDRSTLSSLKEEIRKRMLYESDHLIPQLDFLDGENYEELIDSAFNIIKRSCRKNMKDQVWFGFKDVWIIDFFPLLIRSIKNIKFVVVVRDPRAIVSSLLKLGESDKAQYGNVLSYIRHFRKMVALIIEWKKQPFFKDVYLLKYEDLTFDTPGQFDKLFGFLKVDPISDLNFQDKWKGNSSYVNQMNGISNQSVDRWRELLSPEIVHGIEYLCEAEMKYFSYQPESHLDRNSHKKLEEFLKWQYAVCEKPRGSLGNSSLDYEAEKFRYNLLSYDDDKVTDTMTIRNHFLFLSTYESLKKNGTEKS